MEARQLAYFIFACQHRNHAEAARLLEIPASVLSDNLRLLEKELDTTLFQRGPSGLYPTEAARWLYQSVEPVLRSLEDGEEVLRNDRPALTQTLKITSPLRFLMGRLSRSASLAARALRKTDPAVLVTVDFAATIGGYRDGEGDSLKEGGGSDEQAGCAGTIIVTHGYDVTDPKAVALLDDRWLCVAPFDRVMRMGEVVDFDTLRKAPLYIPALRSPQIRRLRDYCAKHQLPEPLVFDDDIGTLPRLSRSTEAFHLLVPEAMVADSLARLNLGYMVLPEEIKSPIIATVLQESAAAWRYVEFLKHAIQSEKSVLRYDPRITLKQARYFLAVCKELSISAAARQLEVAQPAVSTQIKKLEEISSSMIFERHPRGLKMTARAEALQRVLSPVVSTLGDVVRQAPYLVAARVQRLAIGMIPGAGHLGAMEVALSKALAEWQGAYPAMRLRVVEAQKQQLYRSVETGQISLALVEAESNRGRRDPAARRSRLGLVTALEMGQRQGGEIDLQQAAKLPLILPDDTSGLRQLLQQVAAETHIRLEPRIEINSLPVTLDLLKRERMATILPCHLIEPYLADEAFQFRPLTNPSVSSRLTFLHSASRELTEMEKTLIFMIRARLRSSGIACD